MPHTPDFIPGHSETSAVSLAALYTDALQPLADLTIPATDHGVAQNPAADPSIEHPALSINMRDLCYGHPTSELRILDTILWVIVFGTLNCCATLLKPS
ncbi:hypothetical protein Z517_07990 [Fonsecaea pedrosoi CBS 271.37]|uniref:Uncharacterized protein n=1 Tax=Fonsecaea pedrosoi CBS 271.37 TaxID=1442368 RepID=A0A0D2EVA0_9EURO|nr:uncharacterized protein Z517_07990 [Fonsecaea pedrosoi CBS 271.37]KIW78157.1 hypothetical protein Z517_07990 [Fonsecaea pedrosoi CBS 271.37]